MHSLKFGISSFIYIYLYSGMVQFFIHNFQQIFNHSIQNRELYVSFYSSLS